MTALRSAFLLIALLVPASAFAQTSPATPADPNFDTLWTGWNGASSASMRTESEAMQRVRDELATAEAARRRQLRSQGQALGERVGEIVRERRLRGWRADRPRRRRFPLVEAVRTHCRAGAVPPAPRR